MKAIYTLPIIAIALFSGCAKERDNYDKYLTSGTWTLSTSTMDEKQVETKDYVLAATPDRVVTTQHTKTTSGGKETRIDLNQTVTTPGSTTFMKTTEQFNHSITFTFNKDGSATYTESNQLLTAQSETELGPGPIVTSTDPPTTKTMTIPWNWGNTTETKQILNLYSLGAFEVEIKKDQMVLKKVTTSVQKNDATDGSGNYHYTDEQTETNNLTFTK